MSFLLPRSWVILLLAGLRDFLEQWVLGAVGLDKSIYPALPAYIDHPVTRAIILGRPPSDTDLVAALSDEEAEGAQARILIGLLTALDNVVEAVLLDAQGKLAAVPTSSNPINPDKQLNALMSARRKVSDLARCPEMNAREAGAYLQLSKSAIYEHSGLKRVNTGKRAVRFTTESVIHVKNSAPE